MGLVLKTLAKGTTSNESECVLGAFDVSAWYFPFVNGMETVVYTSIPFRSKPDFSPTVTFSSRFRPSVLSFG